MPLYEYQCEKCGHRFEKIESVSASVTKKCPKCGARAARLPSAPSFQFKGTGWYATDYGGKNAASSAEKSEEKAAAKSDDKADKKPSAAKETAKKTRND